jgi:hypothetical protein
MTRAGLAHARHRSRMAICGVIVLLLASAGHSATYRVDDSASQVLDATVRMQWEAVAPGAGASPNVVGQTTVIVRLAVAPWRGRQGRIFMTLPPRPDGPIEAAWTTRGRLQPGSLRSGERATVYAGLIDSDLLEDTLVIRLTTSGERMDRDEALEFSFEIEVD